MKGRFSILIVVAIMAAAAAGCNREETPVVTYQQFDKDNSAMATNAASRLVMDRQPPAKDGTVSRLICSEPSPDVAIALSTALALTGSAKTPTGVTASAGVSESTAEAITALAGRTEAVVALRDGLFKACEAYANGLIHKEAYALILSQYGDLLVTLMLGEAAATSGQKGGTVASPGGTAAPGGAGAAQPGTTVTVGRTVTLASQAAAPSTPSQPSQQPSNLKIDLGALQKALDAAAKAKPADASKAQAALLAASKKVAADLAASQGAGPAAGQTKAAAATDPISTIYNSYYAKAPVRILQSIIVACLEDAAAKRETPAAQPSALSPVCDSLYKALSDNMANYLQAAVAPGPATSP